MPRWSSISHRSVGTKSRIDCKRHDEVWFELQETRAVEKSRKSEPTNLLNSFPTNSTKDYAESRKETSLARKGRIRGKSPLLGDVLLAFYSTGLFNGGGCSFGAKASGSTRRYPIININMCDRDALEPVGKWWGVDVRPRAGKAKVCVNGPAYRVLASGLRAELAMNEMMKYGLSNRKVEQWRKVLSLCREGAQTVPR